MVKPLKDILKEIENQKPIIRNFANGGYDDDMGHDEDQAMGSGEFGGPEGSVTQSDVAGLVAAGVLGEDEVEGFITQANNPDQSPTLSELANQQGDASGSQSVTGIFAPAQYPNVSNFGGGKRENNLSKDSGVDDEYKGGFLESLIESLVYGLTLGAVDLEMSGKDAWGGDVSRMGKDQPVGVDVGLPAVFGPVGLLAPEVRVEEQDDKTYDVSLGGGLPGAVQTASNYFTESGPNETSSSVVAKGPPNDPNFYGPEGTSDVRDINRPTIDPSTEVVQAIIEEEKEPDVYANLLSGLYTGAKKGGNVMRYNQGGLTGLASNNPEQYNIGGFLRGMIPALAGAGTMMIPGLQGLGTGFLGSASPYILGGLAGAGAGALTGGKTDTITLAKNFLSGAAGGGGANTALKAGVEATPVTTFNDEIIYDVNNPRDLEKALYNKLSAQAVSSPSVNTSQQGFFENIAQAGRGLKNQFTDDNISLLKTYAGPLTALGSSMALTPTATEGPPMTPQQVAQMTPEQRNKWIQTQREKFPYQRTTFQPPNTSINFAADGGVMEIDEEMESGSFVLPADVVSNIGDGSSTAGHRRLAELFGGGDDYAIGGGILKGPIKGPGGGLDDLIQTGIDGVRVARLSTDEFVVPKDVVRKIGDGSQKAGAEQLYDFMKNVRLNKHGTSQQPKGINMAGLKKMV